MSREGAVIDILEVVGRAPKRKVDIEEVERDSPYHTKIPTTNMQI